MTRSSPTAVPLWTRQELALTPQQSPYAISPHIPHPLFSNLYDATSEAAVMKMLFCTAIVM